MHFGKHPYELQLYLNKSRVQTIGSMHNVGIICSKSLGYYIDSQGIIPPQNKVEVIINYPEPNSVKSLRRFLEMSTFTDTFYLIVQTHYNA